MTKDKEKALKAYLGQLPPSIAVPLATAVEMDRLAGRNSLPYDVILEGLRPVLRAAEGDGRRVPTPLRLFCEPFEDLLVAAHGRGKLKGRIARSSIQPVWDWARALRAGAVAARADDLAGAMRKGEPEAIDEACGALWSEAGAAMSEALAAGPKELSGIAAKLGGKEALEDAQDIAACLVIAAETAEMRMALPRLVQQLDDECAAHVRDVFEAVTASHPDQACYVPLIVLGRLAHPWEILRVVAKIVRQHNDYLASQTDLRIVGDMLLHDLDSLAHDIEQTDPSRMDPDEISQKVQLFARLSQGLTHEIDIRRDGPWGQRLVEIRSRLAGRMERLIDQAAREVAAVLSVKRSPNPKRRHERHADLSRALDPERSARAESLAALLVACRGIASDMAFGTAVSKALDTVTASLAEYSPAILQALREEEEELRPIALAYLEATIAITRHVAGESEAELLRRKGLVAVGS
ncbi:MAG: hypothetical protein H6923_07975 [Alphaproteobacteria bacterium]|nr:hypothetical protein [Alphaproteobacteria bacterium]